MTIPHWLQIVLEVNAIINSLFLGYAWGSEGYPEVDDFRDFAWNVGLTIFLFVFFWEGAMLMGIYEFISERLLNLTQLPFYWKYFRGGYDNLSLKDLKKINQRLNMYNIISKSSGLLKLTYLHMFYTIKLVNRKNNKTPNIKAATHISCTGSERTHLVVYENYLGEILLRGWADISKPNKYKYDICRFYYYRVSPEALFKYLNAEMSHQDLIFNAKDDAAYFVDIQNDKEINNFVLSVYDIPHEYLPKEGQMIDKPLSIFNGFLTRKMKS